MRYATKAVIFVMGLGIIGGSIDVAAAEEFHATYRHSYRWHDGFRHGDRDRNRGWRGNSEHRRGERRRDDRGIRHEEHGAARS